MEKNKEKKTINISMGGFIFLIISFILLIMVSGAGIGIYVYKNICNNPNTTTNGQNNIATENKIVYTNGNDVETVEEDINNDEKIVAGDHTLEYGRYVANGTMNNEEPYKYYSTITLEPNGKFYIKSNYNELSEGDFFSEEFNQGMDSNGIYRIEPGEGIINPEVKYDGIDYNYFIVFRLENGKEFSFAVEQDNKFNDQWHGYDYMSN